MASKYYIDGMSCSACALSVEKACKKLDGVTSCEVNFLTKEMKIEHYGIDSKIILEAVKKAGYKASLTPFEVLKHSKLIDKLIISGVLLVILMYLSMYHMVNLPIFDFLANTLVNSIIQLVITTVIIVLFFNYYISGFKKLFRLSPNMDSLIAIGSSASYLYGLYFVVRIIIAYINKDFDSMNQYHHNLFFDSAAMILVFVSIGKTIENNSKNKAKKSVVDLVEMVPNFVNIKVDGNIISKPVDKVELGEVVIGRVGDILALDGIVLNGACNIDESSITGEAMFVLKEANSKVISGTTVVDGVIEYEVTKTAKESTISVITNRVLEAANSKPNIQKLADKIAAYFVPSVISISLITFIVWMIISYDFSTSLNYAVSVLVISCPCALGLATPVAVMVASGVGAKKNLLFKDSNVLEKLSHIDTILIDKTGTITEGKLEVTDFYSTLSNEMFFKILSSLESNSTHPLAKAVTNYALTYSIDQFEVIDFNNKIGYGISGVVDGVKYYCGNLKYLEEIGLKPDFDRRGISLYLFTENEILGYIVCKDTISKHSYEALNEWKSMGVSVNVITGDTLENATELLSGLPIDNIYASLLPTDKEKIVDEFQNAGKKVMMIGDGINDSIALSKSMVGVAIATGTDVAVNSSDLVLVRHDLMDVVNAMLLAKKTFTIIKENLFWAFIYNIIGIPIAAGVLSSIGIILTPMIASICMSISSIFVVTNAIRIQSFTGKEIENMFEMKFYVKSMMCQHCERRVLEAIKAISGVKEVKIDLKKKSVLVKSVVEISFEEFNKVLKVAGYEATK